MAASAGSFALLPAGSRPYDVLCLGLNALDHLCLVDEMPRRGGKTRMRGMAVSGGGMAATAACALARLDWRVAYAGAVGNDQAGALAAPGLAEFGVEAVGLKTFPGLASQQAFIMVEPEGERTIVWQRDDACRLEPEHLDPGLVASARALHLDGHFLEASIKAASLAREAGALVSIDVERVRPLTGDLLKLCHQAVGNREFPRLFTGEKDPAKALFALAELGPAWVGRTLGPHGAELLAEGRIYRHRGFAVHAVDTTGAGDVFHAGLLHGALMGWGPELALTTACALAAVSTTALGGRAALAGRGELERFLARQPRP